MKIQMTKHLTTAALIGTMSLTAYAEDKNPYTRANNTWISIDGTVESVTADTFLLDYGNGTVIVEMDDGDRDADAYKLLPDDKVRVSGMIDDDFLETTKIEASSVYVENIGTYFYASAIDDEDAYYDTYITYTTPVVVSATHLQGTVTEVYPDKDEFMLDTGLTKIRVETEEMAYDPLDKVGYQKIEKGDRLSIYGDIDVDFFEAQTEFVASTIVTLKDKSESKKSASADD